MTERRPEQLQQYFVPVTTGLIGAQTAVLAWLDLRTGLPVLLWLANPAIQTSTLIGAVITGLDYAFGDDSHALRAVLASTAFILGDRHRAGGDHRGDEPMTLHEAPVGAVLQRPGATKTSDSVVILSHFSNLFGAGTTYRRYGSFTKLTLDEGADPRSHPEAADDWVRIDTAETD